MLIRPVTDLRNHFPDVEADLRDEGVIYLTKNGYGSAVLISLDEYIELAGRQNLPDLTRSTRKSSKKAVHQKVPVSEGRGFLRNYADPDLIPLEKDAGRIHAARRSRKYLVEANADE